MKILAWSFALINLYFGAYNFLNAIHLLQSTKYSQTATWIFAVLFLSISAASLYFLLAKNNAKPALLLGISPWIFSLVFLMYNMLTSDYK